MRTVFALRLGQSKAIYDALNALSSTAALRSRLNAAQQRLLSITLTDYRNNGVGLPPAERARMKTIAMKLQKLSTNYTNNVMDATKVKRAGAAAALARSYVVLQSLHRCKHAVVLKQVRQCARLYQATAPCRYVGGEGT
eukprot:GHRQ01011864.1.p2 GENE.GHRQ01011864.1~~GHRQ01011864.1.p2  ORF type:complete len:139 (+),score=54.72 GHRQ01011864.1:948-1364(+)